MHKERSNFEGIGCEMLPSMLCSTSAGIADGINTFMPEMETRSKRCMHSTDIDGERRTQKLEAIDIPIPNIQDLQRTWG